MDASARASLFALPLALAGCAVHAEHAAKPLEERPLACALTPADLASRREQLLPGLMRRAKALVDLDDGLRLEFESRPGLLAELVGIIEQERVCCSFLRLQLVAEPNNGPVFFEVTGPAGTREILRSL